MNTLHTRRHFLRTSFLGAAAGWTVPVFLERTFFTLDALAEGSAVQTPTGRDHPILVIVQLAGGNDGLNTVIPHADDTYYRMRPKLAIPSGKALRLDDHFALHPVLGGLRTLFDEGHAATVLGVGYPNPNRSHFRSTDIWQTASDADKVERHGWIGRYFDAACSGEDPGLGIAISRQEPLAFHSKNPKGIAFNDVSQLQPREAIMQEPPDAGEGSSIDMLEGRVPPEGNTGDFLRRAAMDARLSAERIQAVTSGAATTAPFPSSGIGNALKLISRLIGGGMPTRVYYASQGGYDTHRGQAGNHDRLLGDLDAALTAFAAEMRAQKNFDRVLLMTFSEFGRRVGENGSGGTDHGAAAPLFVLGGAIRPGIHGLQPSLTELNRGDLVHTTDFRSVYGTILERWLRVPAEPILGKTFPATPFI